MATASHAPTPSPEATESSGVLGLALRLFWMIIGNVVLAFSGLCILQERENLFSVADISYGVVIPLLVASRYVDIAKFRGDTAYGEPATMAHWRRYALGTLVTSVVAWLLLHGIAYLRMN
jgi:hypothetical protein